MNRFLARVMGDKIVRPLKEELTFQRSHDLNPLSERPEVDALETALEFSRLNMKEVTPMWLQLLSKSLSSLPYIVAGIQHIHGDAVAGATKKQLAMEALGVSLNTAATLDPQHAPAMAALTSIVSTAIDQTVSLMHAAKEAPASLNIAQTPSPTVQ